MSGLTGENTRGPMKRTLKLGTESLNDQMGVSTRGTGRMVNKMVTGNSKRREGAHFVRGCGKMGGLLNGWIRKCKLGLRKNTNSRIKDDSPKKQNVFNIPFIIL